MLFDKREVFVSYSERDLYQKNFYRAPTEDAILMTLQLRDAT